MTMNVRKAIQYNDIADGKHWEVHDLPLSLQRAHHAGGVAFAYAVAAYQSALNLTDDGKLGPGSWAAIRSMPPRGEDPSLRDFPDEVEDQPDDENDPVEGLEFLDHIVSPRTGTSNRLIIGGSSHGLDDDGVSCSNWKDDGIKHFDHFRVRREPMVHFVLHESVTTSVEATNRALDGKRRRKGYDFGIHFNIAADGHICQHNDPIDHRLVHANQLNDSSCGVEVTNPYNPKFGGAPWTDTIASPWWCWKPKGGDRVYCKPTPAQLRATVVLCETLTQYCRDLPRAFPTADLNRGNRRIKGWDRKAKPGPGIVAHRDFASHADGRYLLEHVMRSFGENSDA